MPASKPARSRKRKRTTSNRRTGRPVKGLANLRERLLDAALVAYARIGASATQSKDVAEIAGVAPALVNYYFKDRMGLAEAVASERIDPLLDRIWAPVKDESLPDNVMLLKYTHEAIMVAREYRWFASLWIRELLTEGGVLHKHNEESRHEVARLKARIRRGQQRGLIPPDFNPDLFMWSMIGLVLFPFAAEPALRLAKVNSSVLMDERRNDSEEMMRRALAMDGPAAGRVRMRGR